MPQDLSRPSSDVAFSPSVKAIQSTRGSRRGYERMENAGSWPQDITPDLAAFIEARTTAFLATSNADGQPYIQHRGGPAGFLRVLDSRTIGFADFAGNRQYVTTGNLRDNPKAHLFLMDYTFRKRVKLWGEARVVEDDADLIKRLMPPDYKARAEQAILFRVNAWDVNCPQHIPQMIDAELVATAMAERDSKIAELQKEVQTLNQRLSSGQ